MAQRAQIIDITKSYLPGDPNTFVQNLINTDREDGEEKTLPVAPYEGYNFLPTSNGYRSYFGIDQTLDIGTLTSRAQFILSYQLPNYYSQLIALCEDGIWICDANTPSAAWTQEVVFYLDGTEPVPGDPVYDPLVFEEWSWCIIENVLYMYQQGRATAWKTSVAANVLSIVTHTPSFINMTGQMGIFKAGLRLGFWDSANSISWSSNLNLTDFVPSLETLAGNTIFGDIVGRIITVRSHGEGYIVYATKSIVGVNFDLTGNYLWDAKKVFDNTGIFYSKAVTYGQTDSEHVVYSSSGIWMIGKYNSLSGKHALELIIPNVYDFLKEPRDPVYLDTINSRFVFFNILNPDYVYGLTSFTYVAPESLNVRFLIGGQPWDGLDLPAISLNCVQAANVIKQLVTFAFKSTANTSALWTVVSSESQDGTIGPLSSGGGSRAAETPGFTTADIQNTYASGATLPAELELDVFEHPASTDSLYLGNIPVGAVTVYHARSSSLTQMMLKQQQDWDLFRQHQATAFTRIAAASKVVNTVAGVTILKYTSATDTSLPALPASYIVSDVVIGTYKTGYGNVEMQKDAPLRKLVLRKYWQQGKTITKRTTRSYVNRAGTPVAGYTLTATNKYLGPNNPGRFTPNDFTISSIKVSGPDMTYINPLASAALLALIPATATYNLWSETFYRASATYVLGVLPDTTSFSAIYHNALDNYNDTAWVSINNSGHIASNTVTPIYQDYVDTVTYIIGAAVTASLGTTDFYATQVAYGSTLVEVTSDPATVVVTGTTPIFPTGVSAITFFPPAWTGVETLKIIAASAYPPWHLSDGTLGIELIGDPLTGAAGYPVGETCALNSAGNYAGTEFGTTYSSFPYVLQVGNPAPLYPTFAGALVLDLHLKKWGKVKAAFSTLTDLEAVNLANPSIVTEDDKGMTACIRYIDSTLRVFDDTPEDNILRYGKIGSYRLGMTDILETRVQFRDACTGTLTIDSSLDGRTIDATLQFSVNWTAVTVVEAYPDISARWHIVTLSGNYDLTGLEVRATLSGRR